jgi:hypothetical protein
VVQNKTAEAKQLAAAINEVAAQATARRKSGAPEVITMKLVRRSCQMPLGIPDFRFTERSACAMFVHDPPIPLPHHFGA